jgi:hypothetical protein
MVQRYIGTRKNSRDERSLARQLKGNRRSLRCFLPLSFRATIATGSKVPLRPGQVCRERLKVNGLRRRYRLVCRRSQSSEEVLATTPAGTTERVDHERLDRRRLSPASPKAASYLWTNSRRVPIATGSSWPHFLIAALVPYAGLIALVAMHSCLPRRETSG